MRVIFGLLSLVLTLFVVMQLVKIQATTTKPVPARAAEAAPPNTRLQGSSQQVQEQYQGALDDALSAGQKRLDAADQP
jgi:xanthine dehydrogenase molybdopterin-binding subunit B